jgi:phage virion morphogenesis protein
MAGASVRMELQSETARTALGRLLARSLSLRQPFEEIGASLVASTQQRIEDERDPAGNAWDDLALSTQLRRVGKSGIRGPDHMLRVKGLLVGSLTYIASDLTLQEGSNRVYAALQQFGGDDGMAPGPAAVPARPYLGLSDDDEREIDAILVGHLEGAIQ